MWEILVLLLPHSLTSNNSIFSFIIISHVIIIYMSPAREPIKISAFFVFGVLSASETVICLLLKINFFINNMDITNPGYQSDASEFELEYDEFDYESEDEIIVFDPSELAPLIKKKILKQLNQKIIDG